MVPAIEVLLNAPPKEDVAEESAIDALPLAAAVLDELRSKSIYIMSPLALPVPII